MKKHVVHERREEKREDLSKERNRDHALANVELPSGY